MDHGELARLLDEVESQLRAIAVALDVYDVAALRAAAHALRSVTDGITEEAGVARMLAWSGESVQQHADIDPPQWGDAWAAHSFATTFLNEARSQLRGG
jgi:hypothetical protein